MYCDIAETEEKLTIKFGMLALYRWKSLCLLFLQISITFVVLGVYVVAVAISDRPIWQSAIFHLYILAFGLFLVYAILNSLCTVIECDSTGLKRSSMNPFAKDRFIPRENFLQFYVQENVSTFRSDIFSKVSAIKSYYLAITDKDLHSRILLDLRNKQDIVPKLNKFYNLEEIYIPWRMEPIYSNDIYKYRSLTADKGKSSPIPKPKCLKEDDRRIETIFKFKTRKIFRGALLLTLGTPGMIYYIFERDYSSMANLLVFILSLLAGTYAILCIVNKTKICLTSETVLVNSYTTLWRRKALHTFNIRRIHTKQKHTGEIGTKNTNNSLIAELSNQGSLNESIFASMFRNVKPHEALIANNISLKASLYLQQEFNKYYGQRTRNH